MEIHFQFDTQYWIKHQSQESIKIIQFLCHFSSILVALSNKCNTLLLELKKLRNSRNRLLFSPVHSYNFSSSNSEFPYHIPLFSSNVVTTSLALIRNFRNRKLTSLALCGQFFSWCRCFFLRIIRNWKHHELEIPVLCSVLLHGP